MRLTLYAVGNKMPAWVSQGFDEYQRRFPRDLSFHLVEALVNPAVSKTIE